MGLVSSDLARELRYLVHEVCFARFLGEEIQRIVFKDKMTCESLFHAESEPCDASASSIL